MITWHHLVHEAFNEKLIYYKLAFFDFQDIDEMRHSIIKVLNENHIRSYCIYHLYGESDVLIRAWIPSNSNYQLVYRELHNKLKLHGCSKIDPFNVQEVFYHWPWNDPTNKYEMVNPEEKFFESLKKTLSKDVGMNQLSDDKMKELVDNNIISDSGPARIDGKTEIKIFIVITPPQGGSPGHTFNVNIAKQLHRFLINTQSILKQPSIYLGNGFADIIIKFKIDDINSFQHIDELKDTINNTAVAGLHVRTYTYVATNTRSDRWIEENDCVCSSIIHQQDDSRNIVHYVATKSEDNNFEMKGSLKLDLNNYILTGAKKDSEAITKSVLKTIAAFSNSDGGELLLGVTEKNHILRIAGKEKNDFGEINSERKIKVDAFISQHPSAKDSNGTELILSGVNHEFSLCKNSTMDSYMLTLQDVIKERIQNFYFLKIDYETLRENDFKFVKINVLRGEKALFVDKKEYYIRQNNRTVCLEGEDMINHVAARFPQK